MDLIEVPGAPFRRHPWEVARARFFGRILEADRRGAGASRVLDVGAGDGYVGRVLLQRLPTGSSVTCVDSNYTDEDLRRLGDERSPGLAFERSPPPGAFDALLLLDVLEHVEDDRALLEGLLGAHVAPGGTVLVSVPAWNILFNRHDVALRHFRRYSPRRCRAVLEAAGLRVVRSGGLFHSLLIPRIVQRLTDAAANTLRYHRRSEPANLGQWRGGRALTSLIEAALSADNRVSELASRSGHELPGLSYWALCRKAGAGAG